MILFVQISVSGMGRQWSLRSSSITSISNVNIAQLCSPTCYATDTAIDGVYLSRLKIFVPWILYKLSIHDMMIHILYILLHLLYFSFSTEFRHMTIAFSLKSIVIWRIFTSSWGGLTIQSSMWKLWFSCSIFHKWYPEFCESLQSYSLHVTIAICTYYTSIYN